MSNINVNLTPYLKQWVEGKVSSGRYNNVSEVVREALRLMEDHEREREAKLLNLRAAIDEGIDSGEPEPWEGAAAVKRKARERRAAVQPAEA